MIIHTYVGTDAIDYLEESLLPQWRDDIKKAEEEKDARWLADLQEDVRRMEKALSTMHKYKDCELEITDLETYLNLMETLNEAVAEIEGRLYINSDGTDLSIWVN